MNAGGDGPVKKTRKYLSLWAIGAAAVITFGTLTAATYAWFSSNREVETEKVTSRTGSANVELQISRTGGDNFQPKKDSSGVYYAPLKGSRELPFEKEPVLMPVSTADLKTFVSNSMTNNGYAENFSITTDESLYYHDTIYLRAVGDGTLPAGTKMALYLDNIKDAPIVGPTGAALLTAARLGLRFSDGSFKILTLSTVNQGEGNTRPGGVPLKKGQVLTADAAGKVAAAADPAVYLEDVQIPADGSAAKESLAVLTLNQIYQLDVYFYLEGCDPDCLSERVGMKDATLNLSFFGVLSS